MKKIISVQELKKKKQHVCTIQDNEILLFFKNNKVRAFSGFCPHQGGPLSEGKLKENFLMCPWHGCSFDLQTGACVDTGSCKNVRKEAVCLQKVDVLIKNGDVYV